MRLFEATGDEALDIITDLMTPISELFTDKDVVSLIRSGKRMDAIKVSVKKYRNTVFEIMAICDTGEPVSEYKKHVHAMDIPAKLLMITNHPSVKSLFTGQEQTEASSSGPATETIAEM